MCQGDDDYDDNVDDDDKDNNVDDNDNDNYKDNKVDDDDDKDNNFDEDDGIDDDEDDIVVDDDVACVNRRIALSPGNKACRVKLQTNLCVVDHIF